MGSLTEAFLEAEAHRKDAIFGQAIGSIIQRGMFPFYTGNIMLSLEQDPNLYDFGRTLYIEIETLRNYPFKFKFDEKQLWQAYDPEDYIFTSINELLFNHFRYRPSLPVDDHIILGED